MEGRTQARTLRPLVGPNDMNRFERMDAIGMGVKGALILGGFGTTLSAIQNSLAKENVGAFGIFTRTGSTIVMFTAMGGSYMFFTAAAANLREKNDHYNPAIGGFVAGAILGTKYRSMPAVLGYGLGISTIMGLFCYTGGFTPGYFKDATEDEATRKEIIRTTRRRPVEETVEHLGEGRGVYLPGYQERRNKRIAEKYGVDFSTVEGSRVERS